jgi:thiol:disulfide interchange protein
MKTLSILLTLSMVVILASCASTSAAPKALSTINPNKPYDEMANAQQEIDSALALAKLDRKYVLLDFGGNWCPDCIVLARLYNTEPLKSFVEMNYHLVTIDIGQFDKNLDIVKRHGNPIAKGVPAVVVLDPDGTMIGSTANGALESARSMTAQEVVAILKSWAPKP